MAYQHGTSNVGELRRSGIVKLRDPDMYSLWVKTGCCNLNSAQLHKLADIVDKYGRGYLLFTTRQSPHLPHINIRDVDTVREEMKEVYMQLDRCGPTVRNVNVCYDDKVCAEAVMNSIALAEKMDTFFYVPMGHKVKIGVAGCARDCITSRVLTDIGFIGVEANGRRGYDAFVGGRLGVNPFIGAKMAECLDEDECVRLVQNYFSLMQAEGRGEERAADLVNRLGVERVREALNRDLQHDPSVKPIVCEAALREKNTGTFILKVRATCGEVTSQQVRKIADIAESYGCGLVHFGVRGAPEIPRIPGRRIEDIRAQLRTAGLSILDRGIDNLQTCYGGYCTENNADTQSLLRGIEKLVEEMGVDDLSIRISASGCPNSCGIAHLSDVGFYGVAEAEIDPAKCNGCELCTPVCKTRSISIKEQVAFIDRGTCQNCGQCVTVCPFDAIMTKRKGFVALVGGREGGEPRLGESVAEFLSEEEALNLTERCLSVLQERRSGAAEVIDEIGLEKFKEMLLSV